MVFLLLALVPNKAPKKGMVGMDLRGGVLFSGRGTVRNMAGRVRLVRVRKMRTSRWRMKGGGLWMRWCGAGGSLYAQDEELGLQEGMKINTAG
jgi:hypothetical protein